jgi:diadenosine tetraphosphate (Ap4A) HIT family hydrolase
MNNPFKNIEKERIIHSSQYFYIIADAYPVSPGHLLIISKEEKTDYFQLFQEEQIELITLITKSKIIIEEVYRPDGYNIGMNCGDSAGQTVFHFHCHIIPRYNGDMKNPKGGIRHCIEGRGYY